MFLARTINLIVWDEYLRADVCVRNSVDALAIVQGTKNRAGAGNMQVVLEETQRDPAYAHRAQRGELVTEHTCRALATSWQTRRAAAS